MNLVEMRMRTRIHPAELELKIGKLVTPGDFNVVLTGPARVTKPDGRPLCVYLPGALKEFAGDPAVYDLLHGLRTQMTDNRGIASGMVRLKRHPTQTRTYTKKVSSAIIGAFDVTPQFQYCRQTAWTGRNLPEQAKLNPLLQAVAAALKTHVPERFKAQADMADQTHDEWLIPGTPFTTITVNNTFPTGVHIDKGDLAAGFSTLSVLRRGQYEGGVFVLPEYRLGIDMQDGDLLLMDAHEWHGNTPLIPLSPDAERISLVAYYREKMVRCGSGEAEAARAESFRTPKPRAPRA